MDKQSQAAARTDLGRWALGINPLIIPLVKEGGFRELSVCLPESLCPPPPQEGVWAAWGSGSALTRCLNWGWSWFSQAERKGPAVGHTLGSGLPPPVSSDWTAQRDVLKKCYHPSGFYICTCWSPCNNNNAPPSVRIENTDSGVWAGPSWLQGSEWKWGRHDGCLLGGGGGVVLLLSPLPNLVMWDIFLKQVSWDHVSYSSHWQPSPSAWESPWGMGGSTFPREEPERRWDPGLKPGTSAGLWSSTLLSSFLSFQMLPQGKPLQPAGQLPTHTSALPGSL